MDSYMAAVGRDVGKIDTDSGGLARYSLKLQVPPGIHHDTEPELSLEYCQGAPNGYLGVGWALGGVSCIRRAPSALAYDSFNPPPPSYDRLKPKLTLDGAELLNISGNYDAQDAQYTTETERVRRIVTPLESGFVVRDSTGRRAEYGTTDDSRVLSSGQQTIREWRLKKSIDYHGNAVTYTYVTSARLDGSTADVNTCYISSIRYTSNEKTGYKGNRIVKFEYSSRPDLLIQSVQGDKCTWASLLTEISFGVIRDDSIRIDRSYELGYSTSQYTGDSYLTSVTETSFNGSDKVNLLPSTFGYTTPGVSNQDLFKTVPQQVVGLRSTTNNIALFTMNISGRCLADLACVRYTPGSKQLSIKTYLAFTNADGSVNWKPSDGPGAEATLPSMDLRKGFPSILCPDMNNDGRADFICLGTGFQDAKTKATDFRWTEGSKFMAMDLSGRGTVDIVQIFAERQKLTFRNFPGVNLNGEIGLRDAITTPTNYENTATIDWFQLNHAITGAKSLVRIWATDIGRGDIQIKATTFALAKAEDSTSGFREVTTSLLGQPTRATKTKYNVLPCDINADGTQDIVLATAEYSNGRMALTFTTYLGDGYGGFKKHGDTILKDQTAPMPVEASDYGQFHVTNLNGSNYPSLCYVYQETSSKAYVCLSVDGRSDGSLGEVTLYYIAKDLPSSKMEVLSADINGNGMGDWLLYTLENDAPRVVPIYNHANVTDFLSWAQDSMGLRTSLTYGCLSDPRVYTSSVDWRNYTQNAQDSYPVIAAPNYVVTQLQHRNDSSINSMEYNVLITKTYGKARINVLGRGWQGFEEINTLNASDGVLTTEKYLQSWPLTGLKCQIDTKTPDGQVLKSVKSFYESSFTLIGPWKVYRSSKTLERTDMIDNGVVARSNATKYKYDEYDNITMLSSSETQLGQVVTQVWKRCVYETIDGVTNVLTCEKVSANEQNVNMSKFEPGDLSLTLYENKSSRAILRSISEWCSDVGDFSRKEFTFNDYGKEVSTINSAGLVRSTTYDDIFKSFPVKVTEQGFGVSSTELTAFDEASGLEVARMELNGLLTCYRMDGFGRTIETRSRAAEQGKSTTTASDFLAQRPFVTDASFSTILMRSHLDPQRKITFERQRSPSGSAFICVKMVTYSHDGISGQHELVEYLDSIKQTRKRSSHDADDADKVWLYWEYDSRGQYLFESFPARVPASVDLDWVPNRSLGTRTAVDTLGRPTARVRPAHGDQNHFIVSSTSYLDGGARIQEKTITVKDASFPLINATQLALLERRYVRIGKEELIIENIDENGLCSKFEYDALGRLIRCTDAAGQTEIRLYNSRGQLVILDNLYQNVPGAVDTPAILCQYNAAGQLVSRVNAAKEAVAYQLDAKGRSLLKVGSDGRTVKYVYDIGGFENVSSITIFPNGIESAFESLFEFAYDHRGRIKERKLTLGDGSSFLTSVSYNWQDHEVQTIRPDGTVLTHDYRGSEIASSTLSGGAASSWSLKAETLKYSPHGRPEKLTLQGTGLKEVFTHTWKYDSQGFPITHSLDAKDKSLVKDDYLYNDLDQIARKHEFATGMTTDYLYNGKRLASSQSGYGAISSYTYDAAGSLKEKGGTTIAYSPGRAVGTHNGQPVFDITYDSAGRVSQRVTERSKLAFTYDSLGSLKLLEDAGHAISVEFLSDFEGEMFHRQHSDGSSELFISDDFNVHIHPDGSRKVIHKLTNANNADSSGYLLGTISNTYESTESKRPLGGSRSISIQFTDTKGNVTHTFRGEDASLLERLEYDDFGRLGSGIADSLKDNTISTYEGNYFDQTTGLVNFSGRWYDPLVGRFTTPDDILNIGSLIRTDGLNRYAFENNDPINNVDPTGHWSWSATLGTVISVGLIVGAVALTVATGGAAAPLAAAAVGALAAGGVAGIVYSITHQDEEDGGKFWGGFATTVLINAAIGFAAGGLGAAATPARIASAGGRILAKAVLGGVASVLTTAAERGVENLIYGTHHDLFEGCVSTFIKGAVIGAVFGAIGERGGGSSSPNKLSGINKSVGVRQILEPKPNNPWASMTTKDALKLGAKATLKPGGKLAMWGAKEIGLTDRAMDFGKSVFTGL